MASEHMNTPLGTKATRLLHLVTRLLSKNSASGYSNEQIEADIDPQRYAKYLQRNDDKGFKDLHTDRATLESSGFDIKVLKRNKTQDSQDTYWMEASEYTQPHWNLTPEQQDFLLRAITWAGETLAPQEAKTAHLILAAENILPPTTLDHTIYINDGVYTQNLKELFQGVQARAAMNITYYGRNTLPQIRRVLPLHITSKRGRLYLDTVDLDKNQKRQFRLSNIVDVDFPVNSQGNPIYIVYSPDQIDELLSEHPDAPSQNSSQEYFSPAETAHIFVTNEARAQRFLPDTSALELPSLSELRLEDGTVLQGYHLNVEELTRGELLSRVLANPDEILLLDNPEQKSNIICALSEHIHALESLTVDESIHEEFTEDYGSVSKKKIRTHGENVLKRALAVYPLFRQNPDIDLTDYASLIELDPEKFREQLAEVSFVIDEIEHNESVLDLFTALGAPKLSAAELGPILLGLHVVRDMDPERYSRPYAVLSSIFRELLYSHSGPVSGQEVSSSQISLPDQRRFQSIFENAIIQRKAVRGSYTSAQGTQSEHLFIPELIIHYNQKFYVVAKPEELDSPADAPGFLNSEVDNSFSNRSYDTIQQLKEEGYKTYSLDGFTAVEYSSVDIPQQRKIYVNPDDVFGFSAPETPFVTVRIKTSGSWMPYYHQMFPYSDDEKETRYWMPYASSALESFIIGAAPHLESISSVELLENSQAKAHRGLQLYKKI